jgi:hypothetical protein
MSRRRQTRSTAASPFWGLLAILIIVAIIIKFIWWILGAAALIGLFYIVRAIVRDKRKRGDARASHYAEIAARADQQHQWVMRGDERGIYGPEGAKLMHDIQSGERPSRAA